MLWYSVVWYGKHSSGYYQYGHSYRYMARWLCCYYLYGYMAVASAIAMNMAMAMAMAMTMAMAMAIAIAYYRIA